MNDINSNNEQPLKIDFSKIIVPEPKVDLSSFIKEDFTDIYVGGKPNGVEASFGSVATAYAPEVGTPVVNDKFVNVPDSNITYLNTNPNYANAVGTIEYQTNGNVFANTPTKPSATELQRIVQKLEKLEKMINPNSKKSLILWEEDNSFKNLINSIVTYACNYKAEDEFPIELYDRLKALNEDVNKQIVDGKEKIIRLEAQAKTNIALAEILSSAYVAATAGLPREEYEAGLGGDELAEYKSHLGIIATTTPDTEEYIKAEKAVKSKISNLENSVHVTIDLERTTSKGGALEYIKKEIAPAVETLQTAYDAMNSQDVATEIDGEDAITALVVKKSFAEKVYDTFVRPIANLFKRKSKVK